MGSDFRVSTSLAGPPPAQAGGRNIETIGAKHHATCGCKEAAASGGQFTTLPLRRATGSMALVCPLMPEQAFLGPCVQEKVEGEGQACRQDTTARSGLLPVPPAAPPRPWEGDAATPRSHHSAQDNITNEVWGLRNLASAPTAFPREVRTCQHLAKGHRAAFYVHRDEICRQLMYTKWLEAHRVL